ncbi:MAG: tRNA pseudouridine(55) synthase TruB [Ruminococcaceae bacterium]|nr:tRNA pseudouridine(55) synthase TruB [Oscillospiraceae bacterium]
MANGILVIDKPQGMTSHDVVSRVRRMANQKRVGHGGTLDPMATGVLPVFLGRTTHATGFVQEGGKLYAARMRLGITTDTQDTTGETILERPVTCTRGEIEAVLPCFRGEIQQIPPMYSAISVNGVRLYKLARQGKEIEREPRTVTVDDLQLGEQTGESEWELLVTCSKGLYVRTLIADIGEALGCGAAMSALRRLRAGNFKIENAVTLEEAAAAAEAGTFDRLLRSADEIFADLPAEQLIARGEAMIKNGAPFRTKLPDGPCRLYGADGTFLGLGEAMGGAVRIRKSFY